MSTQRKYDPSPAKLRQESGPAKRIVCVQSQRGNPAAKHNGSAAQTRKTLWRQFGVFCDAN
jgi:hypothetical protein